MQKRSMAKLNLEDKNDGSVLKKHQKNVSELKALMDYTTDFVELDASEYAQNFTNQDGSLSLTQD